MTVQIRKCSSCGQTYYQGQKHTCPIQCVRCGQWFYTSVGHNCTNPPPPSPPPAPATLDDIREQLETLIGWVRPMSIILRIFFWLFVIAVAGLVMSRYFAQMVYW